MNADQGVWQNNQEHQPLNEQGSTGIGNFESHLSLQEKVDICFYMHLL